MKKNKKTKTVGFILFKFEFFLPLSITKIKDTSCRLLGEKASGNHQLIGGLGFRVRLV